MTRRTLVPVSLLLASALGLGLAGCAKAAGSTTPDASNSANAGFGAIGSSPSPSDVYGGSASPGSDNGNGNGSGNGNSNGNGNGNGHTSPSPSNTGPHIISFTAKGAVCPVDSKGTAAPYSKPGEVTISWKISGATGVSLSMDHGLYDSYDGTSGTQKLPFQCDNSKPQTVTHTYTLETTGGSPKASKTISASAQSNPN